MDICLNSDEANSFSPVRHHALPTMKDDQRRNQNKLRKKY